MAADYVRASRERDRALGAVRMAMRYLRDANAEVGDSLAYAVESSVRDLFEKYPD